MTILEITGLSHNFRGLRAIDDVSLSVGSGELVGVIGPNGAGKTTLFNLVSGFITPDQGRICFAGDDVTKSPPHKVARKGLVRTWQANRVVSNESVMQNIVFGQRSSRIRGDRGLSAANHTEELLTSLGLTDYRERKAAECPHGVQRKLGVAIALAARPTLLMLDEPLTGLDESDIEQVIDVISRVREELGVTILWVEHDMPVIMSTCTRIVVLEFGKLIADGAPLAVQKDPAVIQAYLGASHDS